MQCCPLLDNEALFHICRTVFKVKQPKYKDLNWLIVNAMTDATATYRFQSALNGDMRRLGMNLVPFPRARLHFLLLSLSPMLSCDSERQRRNIQMDGDALTNEIWSSQHFLAHYQAADGKFLTACSIYRGVDADTFGAGVVSDGW